MKTDDCAEPSKRGARACAEPDPQPTDGNCRSLGTAPQRPFRGLSKRPCGVRAARPPSWRRHVPSEAQGRIRTDARAGPLRSREARGDSPGFRMAGFGSSSSPAAAEDVRPGAPRQSGSRCAGNACPPGAGQHRAAGRSRGGRGGPVPSPAPSNPFCLDAAQTQAAAALQPARCRSTRLPVCGRDTCNWTRAALSTPAGVCFIKYIEVF